MKKITAILLAVVLVACCFATVATVSAADENLLLGASYTVSITSTNPDTSASASDSLVDTDNKLITNGDYRGDGANAWNGILGVSGVSVEYVGTDGQTSVAFAFEDATTIGALVVKSARAFFVDASVNRHLNVFSVEYTTDGLVYTAAEFTVKYVAIEGAPECTAGDQVTSAPQYYDVVINVTGATDVMGIKVTFDTVREDGSKAYIVQFDEIEGYANAISGDTSDDATSDDATSDDATSDDATSDDATSDDATSDDATSDDATSDDVTSDDATSDDAPAYTNVALGRPYTYANSDNKDDVFFGMARDDNKTLLTDGEIRQTNWLDAGGNATAGTTVELAGTYITHDVTINLDGLNTIDKVVLDIVRRGHNRYCNINKIEVSVKGGAFVPVNFTEEKVVVPDSPKYSPDEGVTEADQFFTINANFDAIADVTAVKVTLDTLPAESTAGEYIITGTTGRGYIVQLDEIMVMGTRTGDFGGGSNNGESNNGGSTGNTGDLGLGIFAVLAVVSLAGVVVAKKVK